MDVRFLKPYRDRYGVMHEAGDEAEFNELIAGKLLAYKIAVLVPIPPHVTKPKPRGSTKSFSPKEG